MAAYGLRSAEQIVGGPAWIRSAGFDIVASSSEAHAMSELPSKLQTLLVERFNLRAHIETTDGAIYLLKGSNPAASLGPRLRRSTVDCASLLAAGQLVPQPPSDGSALCTGRQSLSGRTRTLRATGLPMAQVATMLAVAAERDVIDETGLLGGYDLELSWTHVVPVTAPDRDGSQTVSEGVSLFTAVREQLGLQLVPGRGPVKSLVIDSVGRPTPD